MGLPVAVQLYTVRDETQKDFPGTLEKIAEIGYEGVEFAGFGNIPAPRMKELLDRLGLKAAGSHTPINVLKSSLDEVIEYNLEIGNRYIVCPWDRHITRNGWLEAASLYNTIGEKCMDKGLKFCYHNHGHEFSKFNGEYALDIVYSNTNADFVKAEIDTYWTFYAGVDPAEYVKKYSGRCPLVHLKDMAKGKKKDFTEIGNGIIDIKGIVAAAKAGAAEWLIVEQDKCERPPLESIKISLENLKKINA